MIGHFFNRAQEIFGEFGASVIVICLFLLLIIILLLLVFTILDTKRKKQNDEFVEFNDRHPKVFKIIACLILLILALLAIWLLKNLCIWIGMGVGWLASKVSKLDAVIIVALITGTISIVGTIVAKIIDFRKRKSEYLAQKREQPYEDFLVMYYKILDNTNNPGSYPNEKMIQDIYKFSKGITLWGSKRVVNRWVDFRELANSGKSQEMMIIIEKLMNEMRKDMGTKRVKKGNLLALTVNDIKDYLK